MEKRRKSIKGESPFQSVESDLQSSRLKTERRRSGKEEPKFPESSSESDKSQRPYLEFETTNLCQGWVKYKKDSGTYNWGWIQVEDNSNIYTIFQSDPSSSPSRAVNVINVLEATVKSKDKKGLYYVSFHEKRGSKFIFQFEDQEVRRKFLFHVAKSLTPVESDSRSPQQAPNTTNLPSFRPLDSSEGSETSLDSMDSHLGEGNSVFDLSLESQSVFDLSLIAWTDIVVHQGATLCSFKQIVGNKLTMLILLHSLASISSQNAISTLSNSPLLQKYHELGVQIIIIGKGTQTHVELFQAHTSWPYAVFSTPTNAIWDYFVMRQVHSKDDYRELFATVPPDDKENKSSPQGTRKYALQKRTKDNAKRRSQKLRRASAPPVQTGVENIITPRTDTKSNLFKSRAKDKLNESKSVLKQPQQYAIQNEQEYIENRLISLGRVTLAELTQMKLDFKLSKINTFTIIHQDASKTELYNPDTQLFTLVQKMCQINNLKISEIRVTDPEGNNVDPTCLLSQLNTRTVYLRPKVEERPLISLTPLEEEKHAPEKKKKDNVPPLSLNASLKALPRESDRLSAREDNKGGESPHVAEGFHVFLLHHQDGIFTTGQTDFDEIYHTLQKYCNKHHEQTWGSRPVFPTAWESYDKVTQHRPNQADYMTIFKPTFFYELGQDVCPTAPFLLENSLPYTHGLSNQQHVNLVGKHPDFGPVIISIEKSKLSHRQALMWSILGEKQVLIPPSVEGNREILCELFNQVFGRFPREISLTTVASEEFIPKLCEMEKKDFSFKFKFGLLNASTSCEENSLYESDQISSDYQEFLDTIAQPITLLGWDKYTGGLDNENQKTGNLSYFTQFQGNEIMFHVGALIPNPNVDDPARKRHIGNDIVVLIFKESTDQFDPSDFKSKFNHLWIVVEKKLLADGATGYKAVAISKTDIPSFEPFIENKVYAKSEFRSWLLMKLINGERVIKQHVPIFNQRNEVLRKSLLNEILAPYVEEEA